MEIANTTQPHSSSLYRRVQAMTIAEAELRLKELEVIYRDVWRERAMLGDHIHDLKYERTQPRGTAAER